MALTEGQIQIAHPSGATLILHHGLNRFDTVYAVNEFEPFDRGARAAQTGDIPWGDGEWSGAEFRSGSKIPLTVAIRGGNWAELMDLFWDLDAVCKPIGTAIRDAELTFNAGGVEYLMFVRPRGAKLRNKRGRTGKGWADVNFYALNPAIYSATEYTTEVGLYRLTAGLTVPFTTPFTMYAAVADGQVQLVNSGTAEAALIITIPGPVREPSVSVTGPDGVAQTLYLDIVLEEGDHLDIHTGEEAVVLNDSVSKLHTAYGTWPLLPPRSTSLFEYRASDLTDSRATIRHRWTY